MPPTPLIELWSSWVHYPDSTRSPNGAWVFDGKQDFPALLADLREEEESRTAAQCFELMGAVWDENYFDRFDPNGSSHAPCADASRSICGAWLLDTRVPGGLETIRNRVQALKSEDASRTTADCFQLLGATWFADFFSASWMITGDQTTLHGFFDPKRTTVERVEASESDDPDVEPLRAGAWFSGAWLMTARQKAAANKLKRENPDWEWSDCYRKAGGNWNFGHHQHIIDQGGKTAEQKVWERYANPLVV